MMYFEEITKETLYIALEIVNSNAEYNVYENGNPIRTLEEMEQEFINPESTSAFIKLEDTYIGVIDYLMENPKDHYPWLGLLMIHNDYQGYGFGAQAYGLYETEMRKRGVKWIRLGVLSENLKAKQFWNSMGFLYIKTVVSRNCKNILCFEKTLL